MNKLLTDIRKTRVTIVVGKYIQRRKTNDSFNLTSLYTIPHRIVHNTVWEREREKDQEKGALLDVFSIMQFHRKIVGRE